MICLGNLEQDQPRVDLLEESQREQVKWVSYLKNNFLTVITGHTTKNRKTAGMTTTGTRAHENIEEVIINGHVVNVKPKP